MFGMRMETYSRVLLSVSKMCEGVMTMGNTITEINNYEATISKRWLASSIACEKYNTLLKIEGG